MSLGELFERWQTWNTRDVAEQAARRADTAGNHHDAAVLRRRHGDESVPSAIDALTAQHELAEQLAGWRWHTVTAAREQGASWDDIAAATGATAEQAHADYRARVDQAERAAVEFGIPFRDAERYRAAADGHDHETTRSEHRREPDAADAGGAAAAAAHPADDDVKDDDMGLFDYFRRGPAERAAHARLDQAQGRRLILEQAEQLSDDVWAARALDRGATTTGPAPTSAAEDETVSSTDGDHSTPAGHDPWPAEPVGLWVPPELDNQVLEYLAGIAERDGRHEQAASHRHAAEELLEQHDQWAARNPDLADELGHAGIDTRGWTDNQRQSLLAARADPEGGYWQAAADDRADRLAARADRDAAEHDTVPLPPENAVYPAATVEHISGPDQIEGGLVVGEIALPGGLPPEDDEDDEDAATGEDDHAADVGRVDDLARWDAAWEVADRDGLVLFDPAAPGGFRGLSDAEHREFLDAVRAGQPPAFTAVDDEAAQVPADDPYAVAASESGLDGLSGRELLARAERADNLTYVGDPDQVAAACGELEALRRESARRAPADTGDQVLDGGLAAYISLLAEDPGVERFEEFTRLHHDVHLALGVESDPRALPEPTDTTSRFAEQLHEVDDEGPVESDRDGYRLGDMPEGIGAFADGPDTDTDTDTWSGRSRSSDADTVTEEITPDPGGGGGYGAERVRDTRTPAGRLTEAGFTGQAGQDARRQLRTLADRQVAEREVADRGEQLARWHIDDHGEHIDDGTDDGIDDGIDDGTVDGGWGVADDDGPGPGWSR